MASTIQEKDKPSKGKELSKGLTIALCLGFITLEVLKQTITYASRELHNHSYPIPSSSIVFLTEFCKLIPCFVLYTRHKNVRSFTPSFIFAIPSLIYTVNNNLYLYSLNFMPPPTWNILLQSRVIMTALVYHFIFKRAVGATRWGALFLLLTAISLAEISGATRSGDLEYHGVKLDTRVIVLGLTGASLSTTASITTEYLYKNNVRSFLEQQVQLYFFGGILALMWSLFKTNGHPFSVNGTFSQQDAMLVVFTVILSGFGGLAVALIVKNVDNIAKIYSSSLSVIFTALVCAAVFPHEFELKLLFFIALGIMCISLLLYEIGRPVKSAKTEPSKTQQTTYKSVTAAFHTKGFKKISSAALLLVIPASLLVLYVEPTQNFMPIANRAVIAHTQFSKQFDLSNNSSPVKPSANLEYITGSGTGKHNGRESQPKDDKLNTHTPTAFKEIMTESPNILPDKDNYLDRSLDNQVKAYTYEHEERSNKNILPSTKGSENIEDTQIKFQPTKSLNQFAQGKPSPSLDNRVPNIIHYLWPNMEKPLELHQYLSIKSAKKVTKPEQIFLHIGSEHRPGGRYWDKLDRIPGVIFSQFKRDNRVLNTTFPEQDDNDLAVKLQILRKRGGIFLDTDVVILKPLDKFRRYDLVVNKEFNDIQTSIMFAVQSSTSIDNFLLQVQAVGDLKSLELVNSFRTFVENNLNTILVEEHSFRRQDLVSNLGFKDSIFSHKVDHSGNYGLKLYYEMYGKHLYPHEIGPMDTTFGEIARMIYFGNIALRYPPQKYIPTTFIVPNVVRYVWFGKRQFNFVNYLSVLSVLKFQKPERVVYHINEIPRGEFWRQTTKLLGNKLQIVHRDPANDTFGRPIGSLSDSAQLASLEILKEEGGIFLQNDVILLRNLDFLRNFDFTITMEVDERCRNGLHTGIMLARQSAEMTHELCGAFREYHIDDPGHIGRVMMDKGEAHADWLNIELVSLTRPDWSDWWSRGRLWRASYPGEMNKAFAIHLMCDPDCDKYSLLNSENQNSEFGDIVRHVLHQEDLFSKLTYDAYDR